MNASRASSLTAEPAWISSAQLRTPAARVSRSAASRGQRKRGYLSNTETQVSRVMARANAGRTRKPWKVHASNGYAGNRRACDEGTRRR